MMNSDMERFNAEHAFLDNAKTLMHIYKSDIDMHLAEANAAYAEYEFEKFREHLGCAESLSRLLEAVANAEDAVIS